MKATRKATGLTLIVLSLTVFIMSGCSTDSRITSFGTEINPDLDKGQDDVTLLAQTGNDLARIAIDDDDSRSARFTILAKVQMIDIEGGCFYLKSSDGATYTPVTPGDLILKQGMVLAAKGYIDREIVFFCGNGPAFVIEKYEIIEGNQAPDEDRAWRGLTTNDDMTKDRDPGLRDEDRYEQDELRDRAEEVKKKFEEEEKLKEPTEERAPEMTYDDDEDRPGHPSEDRGTEDARNRGQDDKKKLEEEQRSKDPSDKDRDPSRPDDLFDPEIAEEIQSS